MAELLKEIRMKRRGLVGFLEDGSEVVLSGPPEAHVENLGILGESGIIDIDPHFYQRMVQLLLTKHPADTFVKLGHRIHVPKNYTHRGEQPPYYTIQAYDLYHKKIPKKHSE